MDTIQSITGSLFKRAYFLLFKVSDLYPTFSPEHKVAYMGIILHFYEGKILLSGAIAIALTFKEMSEQKVLFNFFKKVKIMKISTVGEINQKCHSFTDALTFFPLS